MAARTSPARLNVRGLLVVIGLVAGGTAMTLARAQGAAAEAGKLPTSARSEAAATERHIATLHARLHITQAQEPLWQPLAAAMRNSVSELDRVYAQRGRTYDSMSAVQDLKSYAEVQQTHASNVESLIAPFERLYGSFSPAQKHAADETFRRFTENAVKQTR